MPRKTFAKYLAPWSSSRERRRERLAALRARDGDNCRRCRRPIRFDLPSGHDLAAKVEEIRPGADAHALDHLVLCHGRCNVQAGDNTVEVTERVRRKNEAALFEASRKKRRRA